MHPHLHSTPPRERCTPAVCRNASSAAGESEEVNISGPRQHREVSQGVISHLQAEGGDDGLVVADSVAHEAGVFVLRDQERILVWPVVAGGGSRLLLLLLVLLLWRRTFGFEAPEDSVRPGWFSFLTTECNNSSFVSLALNHPKYRKH